MQVTRRGAMAGAAALGLAACEPRPVARSKAFSADGLARLQETLTQHVASGSPPGLVGLVARDEETVAFPLGAMAIGGPPVSRDAIGWRPSWRTVGC